MPHPGRASADRGHERAPWSRDDLAREWRPRWRFSGRAALWIPVIVSFLVQVPPTFFLWRFRQPPLLTDVDPGPLTLRVALALIGPVALLFARRYPGPVVAVVSAAAAAGILVAGDQAGAPYISVAFAIIGAVVRGARVWGWLSVGAAWLITVSLAGVAGVPLSVFPVVAITLALVLLFGVGEGIRSRRQRYDEMRRRAAERRLTEAEAERVRIARELHDVLAHSLSQINVQAGVGLHLIERQPEKAAEALASIKETSKTALDEVRAVLGVLRADAGGAAPLVPEPDLSRLAGLAAAVSAQGVQVTLDDALSTEHDSVPKPVQLAIYRIVQESLTNLMRHSGARTATVSVAQDAGAYRVRVADDGRGVASPRSADGPGAGGVPGGRGLLGMRERAELLGGTLDAGPGPDGGFVVAASIPKTPGAIAAMITEPSVGAPGTPAAGSGAAALPAASEERS
jgi:signal transduction histidine kinase